MRLSRRSPLLASAVAVSLFTMANAATTTSATAALPNLSTATQTTASTAAASTTASTDSATTSASGSAAASSGSAAATTGSSGSSSIVSITGSGSTGGTNVPTITSTTVDPGLTGLPTLSGAYSIVSPSVPPTANAPYMQTSNLPEGTVFIVVGAILGFMAMSVVLWRGLVAWSLHRSVKRAASQQNMSDTKAHFRAPGPPPAPFYKYSDRDSTISLSGLGAKGGRKNARPVTAAGNSSGLFFSPTAGAAGAGLSAPGNRGSNYLPAGYYAAGASAPAGGAGLVPIGHGPSISMTNLGPQAGGYGRARSMGTSPPDSPGLTTDSRHMASSSTLNLNQGYGGQERAPSAYLEDMFDDSALPPPGHMGHSRNNSGSPLRDRL